MAEAAPAREVPWTTAVTIRGFYESGRTPDELARSFGLPAETVGAVIAAGECEDVLEQDPDQRIHRAIVRAKAALRAGDYETLEAAGREIRANAQRAQEESE